jgi:hypothetical protein
MKRNYQPDDLPLSLETRRKIKEQARRDRADFWLGLIQAVIMLFVLAFYVSFILWRLSR